MKNSLLLAGLAVGFIFVLCCVVKVLEPLSPITTLLFVAYFTVGSFHSLKSTILSLTGLILWTASWSIHQTYGVGPSMTVWSMGVIIWFIAAQRFAESELYPHITDFARKVIR